MLFAEGICEFVSECECTETLPYLKAFFKNKSEYLTSKQYLEYLGEIFQSAV